MYRNVFDYLAWANPKSIANSYEQTFYDEHASLFNVETNRFNDSSTVYGVILADVLLKGLLNRAILLESYDDFLPQQLKKPFIPGCLSQFLPFMDFHGEKIYIPTYSPEVNRIFASSPDLLYTKEYQDYRTNGKFDIVDPLKTYGIHLFTSPFCSLIFLDSHDEEHYAFYHVGFETLFFVDKEARLERELPLFDEKNKVSRSDLPLFDSLNRVARDYFAHDTRKMFLDMKEGKLISPSLYQECVEVMEEKERRKRNRI